MSNLILEYRAVCGRDVIEFSGSVNYWIKRGFTPFGGITVSNSLSDDGAYEQIIYAQAMVQYEPE